MKRRSVLQSILVLPAAAAATTTAQTGLPPAPTLEGASETPNTPVVTADETAASVRRTFTPVEFATLAKLGEVMVPAWNGYPGASEAGAAEFLDFLLGCSSKARLDLYRHGLDELQRKAQSRFAQPFASLSAQQAGILLAPLSPFLQAAKSDLLKATFNSRPYIDAVSQTRRPRNASKYFWHPIS